MTLDEIQGDLEGIDLKISQVSEVEDPDEVVQSFIEAQFGKKPSPTSGDHDKYLESTQAYKAAIENEVEQREIYVEARKDLEPKIAALEDLKNYILDKIDDLETKISQDKTLEDLIAEEIKNAIDVNKLPHHLIQQKINSLSALYIQNLTQKVKDLVGREPGNVSALEDKLVLLKKIVSTDHNDQIETLKKIITSKIKEIN